MIRGGIVGGLYGRGGNIGDAVSYALQTRTPAEQLRARNNIGAVGVDDIVIHAGMEEGDLPVLSQNGDGHTFTQAFDATSIERRDEYGIHIVVSVVAGQKVQQGAGAEDSVLRLELFHLTSDRTRYAREIVRLPADGTQQDVRIQAVIPFGDGFRVRRRWLNGSAIELTPVSFVYESVLSTGSLSYIETQSLTAAQKSRARQNIDAIGPADYVPGRSLKFKGTLVSANEPFRADSGALPNTDRYAFIDNTGKKRHIGRIEQRSSNQMIFTHEQDTNIRGRLITILAGTGANEVVFNKRVPLDADVTLNATTLAYDTALPLGDFTFSLSDDETKA